MTPNSRSYLNHFTQPDTDVPASQGVQAWDRYAYSNNNPVRYTDPDGHSIKPPQCPWCDMVWWDYSGASSTIRRALDQSVVIWAGCLFIGCHRDAQTHTISGPTSREHAEAMASSIVGMATPLEIPEYNVGTEVEEGLIRLVRKDQVGTSQPFKTDKLEDGLSVFKGVSSEDVLKELPGQNVPNTTVTIPEQGLPPGTQVIKTPARGLSQFLSDAHHILVRPEGWSIDRFAKAIKRLVGWE